jgi:hypothetical protein
VQKGDDIGKLYTLHAPEVECIAKGKAGTRYDTWQSPIPNRMGALLRAAETKIALFKSDKLNRVEKCWP